MTRLPTENPYLHPFVKPLAFDVLTIEAMSREAFEIVLATQGVEAFLNDDFEQVSEKSVWSHPLLIARHQGAAEERLSAILLSISASYRALDDQLRDEVDFNNFKSEQRDVHSNFMMNFDDTKLPTTVRECCNKIIHADDFRPVYDNGSQGRGEGVYYMTGEIELDGKKGTMRWSVSFDIYVFLEAILETVDFLINGAKTE